MSFFKALPRHYFLLMFAAALLDNSLFLFRHIGADIWFILTWMRCFSEQFWQGDLYPRWCMDVNNGLGTPIFLFYFPLLFWIAALLHPLIGMGLSYYGLFIFLSILASFVAIITCFSWLKDIVEAPYALLASILFVFMPYHLEIAFFRGAFAELWGVIFIPLLFKYIRRIVRGEKHSVVPLALVTGLSLLTHVPTTINALLFGGVYVLVMTGKAWRPKWECLAAVLWGGALAAFYLVPGEYYQQFLASSEVSKGLYGWPNSYFKPDLFLKTPGLERPMTALFLNGLLLAGFSLVCLVKRLRIEDCFIRRETCLWVAISMVALFMVFPASAPLYGLMGPLSTLVFPWRMQMIVITGITYLIAVWMQWLILPARRKTWKLDYGLSLFFLWLVSHFLAASYSPAGDALNEKIGEAKITFAAEYRSKWTDKDRWGYDYLLELHDKKQPPQAAIISGDGTVEVKQWGWRGIELRLQSTKAVTIRINHSYFPVWLATMDKEETLSIHPEDHTGLMLLDVPGGEHVVTLTYGITNGKPYLLLSQWVSIIAFLALAWRLIPRKIL